MAYELRFHPDAVADLERIRAKDAKEHARLVVFIQDWLSDEKVRLGLAVSGYHDVVIGDARALSEWKAAGYDIYRIKLMGRDIRLTGDGGFLNSRFVYAFDDKNQVILILGIFLRSEFDYSLSEPNGRRVAAAYDALGLPHATIH